MTPEEDRQLDEFLARARESVLETLDDLVDTEAMLRDVHRRIGVERPTPG